MKRALTTVLALAMTLLMTMTVFADAGRWDYDGNGWRWIRDNGYVARGEWLWIDGDNDGWAECYCFGWNGYMLANTYYDNSIINSEGMWVNDYGVPYLSQDYTEWGSYGGSYGGGGTTYSADYNGVEVIYPVGTFRYNSQTSSAYVQISRIGGSYIVNYVRDGYDEYGNAVYESVLDATMYQEDTYTFAAVDSFGDYIRFSYYGTDELYDVSFNGGWGEAYRK